MMKNVKVKRLKDHKKLTVDPVDLFFIKVTEGMKKFLESPFKGS